MDVTANTLRRYLHGQGCVEKRELTIDGHLWIEVWCEKKSGKGCRGVFMFDPTLPHIPRRQLDEIRKALAPCLGQRWTSRIPEEDPFR